MNIIIHALTACFVYVLSELVLILSTQKSLENGATSLQKARISVLALATAIIFAVHPVNTSAVTYITQRFTSLATLFYILALITYIKARCAESLTSTLSYGAVSLIVTACAMDTKEIAFTIPLMMTVIELTFFTGKIAPRLLGLLPFFATMSIIPLTLISIASTGKSTLDTINATTGMMNLDGVPRAAYFFTQFRVIITYIRLIFFPINLNLDYDYPLFVSFGSPEVLVSAIALGALLLFGIYLLVKARKTTTANSALYRVSAFGIFWFFITLSMTSSIIPLSDLINEYNLYLALTGFILMIVCLLEAVGNLPGTPQVDVYHRSVKVFLGIVVCILTIATVNRNRVWQDGMGLWEDVVRKSPKKIRPAKILSEQYMMRNMPDKALNTLSNLIALNPRMGKPHFYLGDLYVSLGRFTDAIDEFNKGLAIRNDKAEIYIGLAKAYLGLGNTTRAAECLNKARVLEPNNQLLPLLFNAINNKP